MSLILREIIRAFGVLGTTVLLTLVAVVAAVTTVTVAYLVLVGEVRPVSIQVAALTSSILAPLLGYGFVRLIQQLDLARSRLDELTMLDENTSAYAWSHFQHLCEIESERARRYERELTLVYIRLKGLRDTTRLHGDEAADVLRQTVARTSIACVRQFDLVGVNPNGDVLVLLPESNANFAKQLLERISSSVERATVHLASGDVHPDIQAAYATCGPKDADWEGLVSDARAQMLPEQR